MLDLALPALDHALPDEQTRLAKQELPRWTLGGGTALALRIGHRTSDDIDIFVTGVRLAELMPLRNPAAKAIDEKPQWPGHYIKYERPEGEIDFLAVSLQTSPGYDLERFRSRTVALETAEEIIIKKIRFRAAKFTHRDAFDLACTLDAEPEIVVTIAREAGDALSRLKVRLDVLSRDGAEGLRLRVRPTSAHAPNVKHAFSKAQRIVATAAGLADDPIDAAHEAKIRNVIDEVSWFEPGDRRQSIRVGWDHIDEKETNARSDLLKTRPLESKAMLLARWRLTDPAGFRRWDDNGRQSNRDDFRQNQRSGIEKE